MKKPDKEVKTIWSSLSRNGSDKKRKTENVLWRKTFWSSRKLKKKRTEKRPNWHLSRPSLQSNKESRKIGKLWRKNKKERKPKLKKLSVFRKKLRKKLLKMQSVSKRPKKRKLRTTKSVMKSKLKSNLPKYPSLQLKRSHQLKVTQRLIPN